MTLRSVLRPGPWLIVALLAACGVLPTRTVPDPAAADLVLLRGSFAQGEQPDGNSVLLRGRDGLIVIDTGRHARHSTRILDAARAAGVPIVAIVNTSWHLDHVAGNIAVRSAYPQVDVYAVDAAGTQRDAFFADYRKQLAAMVAAPGADDGDVAASREEIARIDRGDRLLPTKPLRGHGQLTLAGRRLRFGVERNAVSGGDLWVLDLASRTLVSGDLVTLPVPLLDTACAEGWRQSLQRLDALDFDRLMPGHGASMTHAQFKTYRVAFDHLLDCAASDASSERCRAGWLRDAASLIEPSDAALAGSLLDATLGQVLRASPQRRAKYCHVAPAP